MNKIKIGAKEYPLFMSVHAMCQIEEKCGDFSEIGEWLKGKDVPVSQKLERYADIVTALINGGIAKSNADIEDGVAEGEKQNLIKKDFVSVRLGVNDLNGMDVKILNAIRGGITISDDPDAAPVEKDVTLEALDKAKNVKSAAK